MKNLGHFDEKAVELFKANFSESAEFSEKDEAYDFARCQRPDGSFYGTRGQCRKGTSASAKQKDEVGTGKPSKAVKSGGLGEMTIKTRADMKKMSDNELKSHMKLANKVAFQNDVSKLTKAQFDGLADQHKMAKAELDRRGKSRDKKREANVKLNSATKTTTVMSPADRKRAERASAARKVAAEMTPKVKAADKRAKDLNKQADRFDRAFQKQTKITQKNPTKENKDRLKLIQRETRMADRAAKKADREAEKLDRELIRMRKAADRAQR